jgi:hypothetical protein
VWAGYEKSGARVRVSEDEAPVAVVEAEGEVRVLREKPQMKRS